MTYHCQYYSGGLFECYPASCTSSLHHPQTPPSIILISTSCSSTISTFLHFSTHTPATSLLEFSFSSFYPVLGFSAGLLLKRLLALPPPLITSPTPLEMFLLRTDSCLDTPVIHIFHQTPPHTPATIPPNRPANLQ